MTNEAAQAALLKTLSTHVGRERAIGMERLFSAVYGRPIRDKINDTRALRKLVTQLREEGVSIGSVSTQSGGGYYLCRTGSEATDYCDRLIGRAIRSLSIVARIKRVSLPELLGQMRLNLEGEK